MILSSPFIHVFFYEKKKRFQPLWADVVSWKSLGCVLPFPEFSAAALSEQLCTVMSTDVRIAVKNMAKLIALENGVEKAVALLLQEMQKTS